MLHTGPIQKRNDIISSNLYDSAMNKLFSHLMLFQPEQNIHLKHLKHLLHNLQSILIQAIVTNHLSHSKSYECLI